MFLVNLIVKIIILSATVVVQIAANAFWIEKKKEK